MGGTTEAVAQVMVTCATAFAALDIACLPKFSRWEGYRWPSGETTQSFCINTTEAAAEIDFIHDLPYSRRD